MVQRLMRTGMAMARGINRIARQRLEGQDLARLAPAGFNPTATNALVVEAVGWTAALRERLLALAGRPMLAFAPGLPKEEQAVRARQARSIVTFELTEETAQAIAGEWHDWFDLARPWRMGPGGVAFAARAIVGLSDREVVSQICGKLKQAAAELGAEADVGRIAALEAAARALCPDAEAAAKDTEDEVADAGGGERAPDARDAGPPSDEPESEEEDDPPPEPPD